MSKSKFQSEKDKQQSILNCIGSITGNLSEAVISGFNPSVSNNRNSQQSPSFNQTASSPTFNQTASSPTFNQPAAPVPAAPTINQNPSSTQDVWNRLLLPKKQQPVAATSAPDAQETETDVESMDVSQDPKLKAMFDRLGSTPNTQYNVETDKNRGLGPDPDINAISKQINNKNKAKQTFNKYFKVPTQPNTNTAPLGDLSVNKKQRDTIGNNLLGNPVVNGVQMDSPFNNSLKVPFTPDFSGDAPPNINLSSSGNKAQPVAPAVANPRKQYRGLSPYNDYNDGDVPAVAPEYQSNEAQHQDMFAGTLSGRPETDKQNFLGNPNSLKVPFTPDFSGDAPPNINLSSGGNKTQPVAPSVPATASLGYGASVRTPNASSPVNPTQKTKDDFNKYFKKPSSDIRPGSAADAASKILDKQNTIGTPNTTGNSITPTFKNQDGTPIVAPASGTFKNQDGAPNTTSPSVRLNDPYSQEIVTTEMDKANQTSAVPATASLGYGASVRTPPAASTSKNSQTPMRGDEDQGTSETNQMITPNYPDQAQHQDMFAGSGRPADTDRRPGGAEDVAAGIVNKQNTIGTPDTTGTTVFGSKTGDFVAKPQNNNPQTNPGFMSSPQGGPNAPKPKTSAAPTPARVSTPSSKQPIKAPPKDKIEAPPFEAPPFEAPRGSDRGNTKPDKFGNSSASTQQLDKQVAAFELANPNNPAVMFKKQQDALSQADKEKKTREDAKPDYDPNEINRFNSQLARDRQQGILRPGENYKGRPEFKQQKNEETPEEATKRFKALRSEFEKEGRKFTKDYTEDNPLGGMLSRDESNAMQADENESAEALKKDPSAKATTRNRTKYLADRAASSALYNSPEAKKERDDKRETERTARDKQESDDHDRKLLRLQRKTDLTNARNAYEDSQNRKTSSGWNMSSASRGGGGGGAGQPPTDKAAYDAAADKMSKEISNNKQAEWDKKYGQGSGQAPLEAASTRSTKTMKNGVLIAELFDGDFLSNLKDAAAAVGTLATPPEELLYTTGGVMGRAGYTRQGASKRTKHYQNILNSIADLGVNGLANTVGQAYPNATAGVINNTVYPATKVAANMLTRMLYDPRSDEDGEDRKLVFKDEEEKKNEEKAAAASETEPDAPAKKSGTKKSGTPVSPGGTSTGHNPKTPGSTWVKSDTNPVFALANKIKPKTQQIQWNPYKADFSQQQYRAAAE